MHVYKCSPGVERACHQPGSHKGEVVFVVSFSWLLIVMYEFRLCGWGHPWDCGPGLYKKAG